LRGGGPPLPYGNTVKEDALVAVPPAVVSVIFPDFAPAGTKTETIESLFTVNDAALIPPNVTLVAPVKLVPLIVTEVPTCPLPGLKLRMLGVTRNGLLLARVEVGVTICTIPVVAPAGTFAVR